MGLELLESEMESRKRQISNSEADDIYGDINCWYDMTHDIQENTASAVGILNELLKYDKIETGNLEFEVGQVFIWDLVSKIVKQFKLQALKKDIELTFIVEGPGIEQDLEAGENVSIENKKNLVVVGDEMR